MSTSFMAGRAAPLRLTSNRPSHYHYCGAPLEQVRDGLRIKGYSAPGATGCGASCPGCGERIKTADLYDRQPVFECFECRAYLTTLAAEEATRTSGGCPECLARRAETEAENRAALAAEANDCPFCQRPATGPEAAALTAHAGSCNRCWESTPGLLASPLSLAEECARG